MWELHLLPFPSPARFHYSIALSVCSHSVAKPIHMCYTRDMSIALFCAVIQNSMLAIMEQQDTYSWVKECLSAGATSRASQNPANRGKSSRRTGGESNVISSSDYHNFHLHIDECCLPLMSRAQGSNCFSRWCRYKENTCLKLPKQ